MHVPFRFFHTILSTFSLLPLPNLPFPSSLLPSSHPFLLPHITRLHLLLSLVSSHIRYTPTLTFPPFPPHPPVFTHFSPFLPLSPLSPAVYPPPPPLAKIAAKSTRQRAINTRPTRIAQPRQSPPVGGGKHRANKREGGKNGKQTAANGRERREDKVGIGKIWNWQRMKGG